MDGGAGNSALASLTPPPAAAAAPNAAPAEIPPTDVLPADAPPTETPPADATPADAPPADGVDSNKLLVTSDTELMTSPPGTDEPPAVDPTIVDVGNVGDVRSTEWRSAVTGPPSTGVPPAPADHGDGAWYSSCAAAATSTSNDRCSTASARIHDGDTPAADRWGLASGVTVDAMV